MLAIRWSIFWARSGIGGAQRILDEGVSRLTGDFNNDGLGRFRALAKNRFQPPHRHHVSLPPRGKTAAMRRGHRSSSARRRFSSSMPMKKAARNCFVLRLARSSRNQSAGYALHGFIVADLPRDELPASCTGADRRARFAGKRAGCMRSPDVERLDIERFRINRFASVDRAMNIDASPRARAAMSRTLDFTFSGRGSGVRRSAGIRDRGNASFRAHRGGEAAIGSKIGFTNRTIWAGIRCLRADLGPCVRHVAAYARSDRARARAWPA